jgi:hypothetical protein
MKIDACNYEDNLFDNKSIIVNCILNLDNDSEYKIKAMIDNDCINYSFIDINIAHKMCELLSIALLKLNKSREVKNYVLRFLRLLQCEYRYIRIDQQIDRWFCIHRFYSSI